MTGLTRLVIGHSRLVLGLWVALIGTLGAIGIGVEDDLHRSDLSIPGSGSAQARALTQAEFGESNAVSVLLRGPAADLRRQGKALADRLERHEGVVVLDPWSADSSDALRPAPDQALLLVRADLPFEQVSIDLVPELRADLAAGIEPPVQAHLTGFPDLAAAIHGDSISALQRAETIAAPLLAIVLMFVFRSLVAAALPLILGFATIGAGAGVLALLNRLIDLDASAMNLMTAMGLALGVDYSLLIVSRFREQLDDGADPVTAVETASRAAGGTVIFAGLALSAAVAAALLVAPGGLLTSAVTGALVAALLSILSALTALPAALMLLGRNVDRGRLGRDRSGQGSSRFALGLGRRPAVAIIVSTALVLLCVPAFAMQSGAPDPRALSSDSVQRADFETFRKTLGVGWAAPFEVIVSDPDGSISDPEDLRALTAWQKRLEREPGIRSVFGPDQVAGEARRLRRVPDGLERAANSLEQGERAAGKLDDGAGLVDRGVAKLRSGITRGAEGAERLSDVVAQADSGIGRLVGGLGRAGAGSARLLAGIKRGVLGSDKLADKSKRLRDGARLLDDGVVRARRGVADALPKSERLVAGLREGRTGLSELAGPAAIADRQLDEALRALGRMLPSSKADPRFRDAFEAVARAEAAISGRNPVNGERARAGYDGLVAALGDGRSELGKAVRGASALDRGLEGLERGLGQLARGSGKLVDGAERAARRVPALVDGLDRLSDGAKRLDGGVARLKDGGGRLDRGADRLQRGSGRLADGLGDGGSRSRALERGTGRLSDGTGRFADRLGRSDLGGGEADLKRLDRTFDSGNLVTAAVQESGAADRAAASFIGNFDRGGSAAKLVVIARADPTNPEETVRDRLAADARKFERDTGMTVAIGGPASVLQDFSTTASGRLPLLIAVLVLVTYLVLVPMFRSLLLPLLAVLLNVVTVAAAFGVLVLLLGGEHPPLGGTGQLDAVSMFLIFSIIFGLAIDYEVFLIMRMREGYLRFGTTDRAVEYGLRKTAGIVTGAALIMTGVFVAFALADIATIRQLGVGLTVAVLIDATLVRLVLLPAAMRLCGEANWWLPAWLDRRLPRLDFEG